MNCDKLVSFCLFTYNQEAYIKDAVESALNQTYSPLEIIISDDCSQDATFQIIEETVRNYNGPHKVILNKNKRNMGLGRHFSDVCCNISTGDYLVVLGGDDISEKGHVQIAAESMDDNPEAQMIDFNGYIINSEGKQLGIYEKLLFEKKHFSLTDYLNLKPVYSFAPGRIFRRALVSEFDPISPKCPTEDSVLVLRSLLFGGLIRLNKPLVFYRQHDNNLSGSNSLKNISDIAIIAQYYSDVLRLFHNGRIDAVKCSQLIERINLEHNFRKITYKQQKSKFGLLRNRLYLKIQKLSYLRTLRTLGNQK